MKSAKNILHILPHAGGGVGSVIRALLTSELQARSSYIHSVALLEGLNETTKKHFETLGISWADGLAVKGELKKLFSLMEAADVVLMHWWNHPLLMRLLFEGLPPCRLALWSHVNGFHVPQAFPRELFEVPDRFIFATKASMQIPVVQALPEELKHKLRVIRSCAGLPAGSESLCVKNKPFTMGYVGTVEPAKMHADFLKLCAAAKIPTPCIVAGGPAHDDLKNKAEDLGLAGSFEILGPVADPLPVFRRLHALAYPLNPNHYGTGEQVLIEAMAFGAVPVVLANPPEKALVKHGVTGLVAKTPMEFSQALRFLADNPVDRGRLANAGRQFVLDECGIAHSLDAFHVIFEELSMLPKRSRRICLQRVKNVVDGSPFHLFLASCGNNREGNIALEMIEKTIAEELVPPSFYVLTRGSPAHYLRMLGPDKDLERLCRI